MQVVDYDGWRTSELSQDTSTWERHEFTICEMAAIVHWYLVDPEMIWVRVRRVCAERVVTQCSNGRACEDAECPFLHNGDVFKDDIVEELGDYANLDNYTYYSLELGPGLVWPDVQNNAYNNSKGVAKQLLKDIGHTLGRIYTTNRTIHISLAYSQLVSSSEARWIQRGCNHEMRRYWSLAPHDRVEDLAWNRKFSLKQEGWETVEAMDIKVDLATWGEMDVTRLWGSGHLWHNCRPSSHHSHPRRGNLTYESAGNVKSMAQGSYDSPLTSPSHNDFTEIQQTWANAHRAFIERSRRAYEIEKQSETNRNGKGWLRLNVIASLTDVVGTLCLKNNGESEPFDLAIYLTDYLHQVSGITRSRFWSKQLLHKIQSPAQLHVTLLDPETLCLLPSSCRNHHPSIFDTLD